MIEGRIFEILRFISLVPMFLLWGYQFHKTLWACDDGSPAKIVLKKTFKVMFLGEEIGTQRRV